LGSLSEQIARNSTTRSAFLWKAELFIGERYNNPVFRRTKEHHSFCSELIGKSFPQFGIVFPEMGVNLMPIGIANAVMKNPSDWAEVTEEYFAIKTDQLYQRLHDYEHPDRREKNKKAFRAAQKVANEGIALIGEAIEGLDRFEHWRIEKHAGGSEVRTHSAHGSHFADEIVEWLSLFVLDENNDEFRTMFGGD
jgi:hypothetical protein